MDRYFNVSRASWLTIPRALINTMPDEWKSKLADLLDEYDETFTFSGEQMKGIGTRVMLTKNGKLTKSMDEISNYRHPNKEFIERECK